MTMQDPKDLDGQPLELLIKIMNMTGSDSDNITLVAIKRANAHLLKMGTSWDALLRGKVKIIADPFASISGMPKAPPDHHHRPAPPPPPASRAPWSGSRTPPPPPPPPPPPDPAVAAARAKAAADARAARQAAAAAAQANTIPKADEPPFAGDSLERTIVNKHAGTCYKCGNKVHEGEGLAKQYKRPAGKTYWKAEHEVGKCPAARKFGSATTTDNLQF